MIDLNNIPVTDLHTAHSPLTIYIYPALINQFIRLTPRTQSALREIFI